MKRTVQYTLRGVPGEVDDAIRKLAVREGASLNATALDVLKAGAGVGDAGVRHHELDTLAGTWVQDEAFDRAQEAFETLDPRLWS